MLKKYKRVFTSEADARVFYDGALAMRDMLENDKHSCSITLKTNKDGNREVRLTEEKA